METTYIYQLVVLLSTSFMAAFAISLNNFANDKMQGKQCIPLLYISECLVSGLSGFFLSVLVMTFKQNLLPCMFTAGIGGLLGRKLLLGTLKVLLLIISNKNGVQSNKIEELLEILTTVKQN